MATDRSPSLHQPTLHTLPTTLAILLLGGLATPTPAWAVAPQENQLGRPQRLQAPTLELVGLKDCRRIPEQSKPGRVLYLCGSARLQACEDTLPVCYTEHFNAIFRSYWSDVRAEDIEVWVDAKSKTQQVKHGGRQVRIERRYVYRDETKQIMGMLDHVRDEVRGGLRVHTCYAAVGYQTQCDRLNVELHHDGAAVLRNVPDRPQTPVKPPARGADPELNAAAAGQLAD